jgi:hypothetical protein
MKLTEQEIRSVQEPEFTKSWHPVSHGKVIDALEIAVDGMNLGTVSKIYSLNKTGMNMFGTWKLEQEKNGISWMIGFRNSMSKAFAIGICAGTNVIACSNMMFSDEFIELRRHTSGVDLEELRILSEKAISGIYNRLEALADWHNNLKNFSLKEDEFKILLFNAMKKRVVAPSKFEEFLACHDEEYKLNGQSLYSFHGACTRLVRKQSLFNIAERTQNLTEVCNNYIKIAA